MRTFDYQQAEDVSAAIAAGAQPETRFLAGGTTLLDLMKLNVERPSHLVDITRLPGLNTIDGPVANISGARDYPLSILVFMLC
jgi:CO/xanthine dehydrogenase FAD-binding subunit